MTHMVLGHLVDFVVDHLILYVIDTRYIVVEGVA